MCKKNVLIGGLLVVVLLLGGAVANAASDVFSVNFYDTRNLSEAQYGNVMLEADQSAGFGDWETRGWVNVFVTPGMEPVPITSVVGQTATLAIPSVCNAWRSRTLDGTRAAAVGDDNGDLFDVGAWGTEDQSLVLDMTVSDIPFATYEVIVYLGHHPFAGGARTGVFTFNETPMELGVTEGPFDGTFTQIVNSGDMGNYIVYEKVKGPSFRVQLWGYGTNHVGICGFQFREANPTLAADPDPADEVTDVPRDVVLSWKPGESANTHDVYLGTVFDDVSDADRSDPRGVLAGQGQSPATYEPDNRLDFGQIYYWRIDEVNAPPDSTIL